MKKGFLQISFAWLFGIIAGAIILALAITIATKITNIGQHQTSAETQKQISVLLNPLETGFQNGQVTTLSLSAPTRIYNTCENQSGLFGKQIISISQQSFGRWSQKTQGAAMQNKYIFSDSVSEGEKFFLFTKPFKFPFKVADLIYLTSSSTNYCFINPPLEVYNELSNLNQKNIILKDDSSSCPSHSIKVCFISSGVDCSNSNITVDYTRGTVEKKGATLYFNEDALMYAAIFSNKKIYDCQVKRLMKREAQLSKIYIEKLNIIQKEGCKTNLNSDLLLLENSANNFKNPESDLNSLIDLTNNLKQENEVSLCPLW